MFDFSNFEVACLICRLMSEIDRDWLPLSVADERWQTSWGIKKQTKSTLRNRRACSELPF
jgi:hypothetical protein